MQVRDLQDFTFQLRARDNLEFFCLLEKGVQSALNASTRHSYCKTFRGYHIKEDSKTHEI